MSTFNDNFSPSDFFDISLEIENSVSNQKNISINSKDAAWLRSSISRAYYSAFLAVRNEFLKNNTLRRLIKNLPSDHRAIKTKLQSLPANHYYLAQYFEQLRTYRNNADYDLPPRYEVNHTKAHLANNQAKKILDELQTIMQNI